MFAYCRKTFDARMGQDTFVTKTILLHFTTINHTSAYQAVNLGENIETRMPSNVHHEAWF